MRDLYETFRFSERFTVLVFLFGRFRSHIQKLMFFNLGGYIPPNFRGP